MTQGKGGGPKTPRGKARVGQNALKHGIHFDPIIIEGLESREEWEALRDGIVESLSPVGALEEDLAQSLAQIRWRLRRVTRFETAAINHRVHSTGGWLAIGQAPGSGLPRGELAEPDPMLVAAYQERAVVPFESELGQITRYEAHLHRLYLQTRHDLEALQAARRGERASVARISVVTSPRGTGPRPQAPDILGDLRKELRP
jgi:hypothetical protein